MNRPKYVPFSEMREKQTHLDTFLRRHHKQVTRGKNTERCLFEENQHSQLFYVLITCGTAKKPENDQFNP